MKVEMNLTQAKLLLWAIEWVDTEHIKDQLAIIKELERQIEQEEKQLP